MLPNETDAARPLDFGSTAGLGPDERAKLDALLDHIYEYGTNSEGVLRLAEKLCRAARADERERLTQHMSAARKLAEQHNKRGDDCGMLARTLLDALRSLRA